MLLEPGRQESFEKEPENAWVYRVLGLDIDAQSVDVVVEELGVRITQDGVSRMVSLNKHRRAALMAWQQKDAAVGVVIGGPQGFLMQRKDDKHPNPKCRGLLCLFSGSANMGEDPFHTVVRELYEEIRDPEVVDEIAELMKPSGHGELPSVQWKDNYWFVWFSATTDDPDQFERWKDSMFGEPGLGESDPALVTHEELRALIAAEDAEPGKHFVSSHHVVLGSVLP